VAYKLWLLLILPESFKAIRRERSISCRVLDVAVSQIGLQRAGIMAVVRQLITASVLGAQPPPCGFWHLADIPVALINVRFRGVKRTSSSNVDVSANDPKRTCLV
jgi:hypothetical protein